MISKEEMSSLDSVYEDLKIAYIHGESLAIDIKGVEALLDALDLTLKGVISVRNDLKFMDLPLGDREFEIVKLSAHNAKTTSNVCLKIKMREVELGNIENVWVANMHMLAGYVEALNLNKYNLQEIIVDEWVGKHVIMEVKNVRYQDKEHVQLYLVGGVK